MNPSETDQSSVSSAKPKFGAKFLRQEGPVLVQHEIAGDEADVLAPYAKKTKAPSTHTHPTSALSTEAPSKFTFEDDWSSHQKSPSSKEENSKILTTTESSSTAISGGQKSSVSETRRPVFITGSEHHTTSDTTSINISQETPDVSSPIYPSHKGMAIEQVGKYGRIPATYEQSMVWQERAPITYGRAPAAFERAQATHDQVPPTDEGIPHTYEHAPATSQRSLLTYDHAASSNRYSGLAHQHERAASSIHHNEIRIEPAVATESAPGPSHFATPILEQAITYERAPGPSHLAGPIVEQSAMYERAPSPHHRKGSILGQAAAVASGLFKQAALGINNLAFTKEEIDPSAIPRFPPSDTTSPLDRFIIQAGTSIADGLVSAGEIMLGAANAAFPRQQKPSPPKIKLQELVTTRTSQPDDVVYREFTLLPRAPGAHQKESEDHIQREEFKNTFKGEDPVQIYVPPEDLRRKTKPNTHVMLPLPPASGVDLTKYSDVNETMNETEQRMMYLRGLALAKQSFYARQPATPTIPIDAQSSHIANTTEITSRYLEALEMTCKKANEQTAMLIDGNTLNEMPYANAATHVIYKQKKCLGKQICVMETIHSTDSSASEEDELSSPRTRKQVPITYTGSSSDTSYMESKESKDVLKTEYSITSSKTSNLKSSSKASAQLSSVSDYPMSKKRGKVQKGMAVVCPWNTTSSSDSVEKPSVYTIQSSDLRSVKLQTSDKKETTKEYKDCQNYKTKPYVIDADETTVPNIEEIQSLVTQKSKSAKGQSDYSSKHSHAASYKPSVPRKLTSPKLKTRIVGEIPTQTSYISASPKQKSKHGGETRTSPRSSTEKNTESLVKENKTSYMTLSRKQKVKQPSASSVENSVEVSAQSPLLKQVKERSPCFLQKTESKPKSRTKGQTSTQTSFLTTVSDTKYFSSINTSLSGNQLPLIDTDVISDNDNTQVGSASNDSITYKHSDQLTNASNISTVSDIHYLPSLSTPYSETRTPRSTSAVQPDQLDGYNYSTYDHTAVKNKTELKKYSKGCNVRTRPVVVETMPLSMCIDVGIPNVSHALLSEFPENSKKLFDNYEAHTDTVKAAKQISVGLKKILENQGTSTDTMAVSKETSANIKRTEDSVSYCDAATTAKKVSTNVKKTSACQETCINEITALKEMCTECGEISNNHGLHTNTVAAPIDNSINLRKLTENQGTCTDAATLSKEKRGQDMQTECLKHMGKMKGGSLASGMDKATLITTTRTGGNKDFSTSAKRAKRLELESAADKVERINQKLSSKQQKQTTDSYHSHEVRERHGSLTPQTVFESHETEEAVKKFDMNWMLASLLKTLTQKNSATSSKKMGSYERFQHSKLGETDTFKNLKFKRSVKNFSLNNRNGNVKAFHSLRSSKFPASVSHKPVGSLVVDFSKKANVKQNSKLQRNHVKEEKMPAAARYKSGTSHTESATASRNRQKVESQDLLVSFKPKINRRLGITLYLAPPLEPGVIPTNQEEKATVLKFYLGHSGHKPIKHAFLNKKFCEMPDTTTSTSNSYDPPTFDVARRMVFEVDSQKTTDKLTIIMQSERSKPYHAASPKIRAELIENGKRKILDEYLDQPSLRNVIQAVNIEAHPATDRLCTEHPIMLHPPPPKCIVSDLTPLGINTPRVFIPNEKHDKDNIAIETICMQPNAAADKYELMTKSTAEKNCDKPHTWKMAMSNALYREATEQEPVQDTYLQQPGIFIDGFNSLDKCTKKNLKDNVYVTKTPSPVHSVSPPTNDNFLLSSALKPRRPEVTEGDMAAGFSREIEKAVLKTENKVTQKEERAFNATVHDMHFSQRTKTNSNIQQAGVTNISTNCHQNCQDAVITGSSPALADSANIDESFKIYLQNRYAEIFATDVNKSNLRKVQLPDTADLSQQQVFYNNQNVFEEKDGEDINQSILAKVPQLVFSDASKLFQAESFYQRGEIACPNSGLLDVSVNISHIKDRHFSGHECRVSDDADTTHEIMSKRNDNKIGSSNFVDGNAHLVLSIPSIAMGVNSHIHIPTDKITTYCSTEKCSSSNMSTSNDNYNKCSELAISDATKSVHQMSCSATEVVNCLSSAPHNVASSDTMFNSCGNICTRSSLNPNQMDSCDIINTICNSLTNDRKKSVLCTEDDENDISISSVPQSYLNIAHCSSIENENAAHHDDLAALNSLIAAHAIVDQSLLHSHSEQLNSSTVENKYLSHSSCKIIDLSHDESGHVPTSNINDDDTNPLPRESTPVKVTNLMSTNTSNQTAVSIKELPLHQRKIGALSSVAPFTQPEFCKVNDSVENPLLLNRQSIIGADDYRALVASLPRLTRPYKKNLTKLLKQERKIETNSQKERCATSFLQYRINQLASISEARDSEVDGQEDDRSGGITFIPLLPPDCLAHQLKSTLLSSVHKGMPTASEISPVPSSTQENSINKTTQDSRVAMLLPLNLEGNYNSAESQAQATNMQQCCSEIFRQLAVPVGKKDDQVVKGNRQKMEKHSPATTSKAFHLTESSQTIRRQLEQQTANLLQLFTPTHEALAQDREEQ